MFQLFGAAEQRGLALARVLFDPQNPAVRFMLLLEEFVIVEDLLVRVVEKTAFGMLDAVDG